MPPVTIADDWLHDDQAATPPDDGWRRTWRPIALDRSLDGQYEPPQPTVGTRSDGCGLFYPGRMHTVASESEGGKTWFALAATRDELAAGNHVIYLDFEDDEGALAGRLLTLGEQRDRIRNQFHYLRPEDPLGTGINLDDLQDVLTTNRPTLAIVDGVTEAMTMHSLNPLDNGDVAKFGRILNRRLAASGAATVALDHVTKDREGRGRYALGAVHKLNGLNGAAYVLDNRTPFGVGLTGRSTLKISKDRPGQLRRNGLPSSGGLHWYGDLVLDSHSDNFAEVTIEPPTDRGDSFRPTHLMEKIYALVAKHAGEKGLSGRQLQDLARGNAQNNRQAITLLQVEGYISPTPHRALKPFHPDEDDPT